MRLKSSFMPDAMLRSADPMGATKHLGRGYPRRPIDIRAPFIFLTRLPRMAHPGP
jgi:hypothetical protein